MAQLIFYDKSHEYTLNDELVPSVSEISRFASREIYGQVAQFALDNACNRGSAVHKATEVLDKYGDVECGNEIAPYVQAYVQFRKDYGIDEYVAIEKALASEEKKFAGTIDRIYRIDEKFAEKFLEQTKVDISAFIGKLAIIDLKSSSAVQKVLAKIQLNGYEILVVENGIGEVALLIILHLQKDGNYKLHNIERDRTLFESCWNLHEALKKKPRKKKGE